MSFLYVVASQAPEYALALTEIDIGNRNCSIALAKAHQFTDTLESECVSATFALTDGTTLASLSDGMNCSWKPLKGETYQIPLKSDYQWQYLIVLPTIDIDLRKTFYMSKDEFLFFALGVSLSKNILSIDPTSTMVRQLGNKSICKKVSPQSIFCKYTIIPRIAVNIS